MDKKRRLVFRNPCNKCIVRVNCSQICESKKTYGSTLPLISFILTLLAILPVIPLTHILIYYTSVLNSYGFAITLFLYIILLVCIICPLIIKLEDYMEKIRNNHYEESHHIQTEILRRKGYPVFPRKRKIRWKNISHVKIVSH